MSRPQETIASGLLLAALATALAGCPRCPGTAVGVEQLVAEHNANAAAVPRLWARVRMRVTLADRKGRTFGWGSASPLATPNGLLLLGKGADPLGPHDFVLSGRELAGVELFRIGSSTAQGIYYCWYQLGDNAGAFWGRHEYAGAPGIEALPIDPNQLLAVLGICAVPDDLTALPAVAMTLQSDPCAYVLTYVDRRPVSGRIDFRRKVYFRWADEQPRRPFRVDLLSPDGRCVLTARLSRYRPIAGPSDAGNTDGALDPDAWLMGAEAPDESASQTPAANEPDERRPVMPTDIVLERVGHAGEPTPDGAEVRRVHLRLSNMTTSDKWDRAACRFDPPTARVIQVDRGVESAPPRGETP
ncbi:MAG: hypothetical protein KGY99_02690 [Phycisphaerae bacterium]|nr:hypothetical protein [Phycisphaerae bacterium]